MINKDDFYLKDIELCKQLAPSMRIKGIEPDGWWGQYNNQYSESARYSLYISEDSVFDNLADDNIPTWREDSLKEALPSGKLLLIGCGQKLLRSLARIIIKEE